MREKLMQSIETLRNLYYLTQDLRGEGREHIQELKRNAQLAPDDNLPEAVEGIQSNIEAVKEAVGCKLSDDEINKAVQWLTSAGDGYVCLSKRHIEKGFDNYAWVFPRWPHIPGHAYVQFDSNIDGESPQKIFLAEQVLFGDIRLLWSHILRLSSDGKTWKIREASLQQELSSYMRLAAAAIYHFLEAYLNGIAYNCFQDFHDSLDIADHDLLAEWNSGTQHTRYATFERKLKEYPRICGKYVQRDVDLAGDKDVEYLLGEGKMLRDALTHPAPFVNFQSEKPTKMQMLGGITPEQIQRLLFASIEYVRKVEIALGHDVAMRMPWLKMDLQSSQTEGKSVADSK